MLAEPPAADVAASERMGLFVVSHLAARHGVRVRLRGGQDGLVAQVRIPAELLAPAPAPEPGAPASPRMLTTQILAATRPSTPPAVPAPWPRRPEPLAAAPSVGLQRGPRRRSGDGSAAGS